jgi:hypothetical protein
VLKAMVLSVAMITELLNSGFFCTRAWASPSSTR